MKTIYLGILPLLLLVSGLSAATHTVDNNAGAVADFSSLSAAISAADPGDTILIAASPTFYGDFNIYKELHFVGTGYFKSTNGISGLTDSTSYAHLRFKKDNALGNGTGSSVTGMQGYIENDAGVTVTIDKCYYQSNWTFDGPAIITRSHVNGSINFRATATTSSISNTITSDLYLQATGVTATNCVIRNSINPSITGTTFTNCIFLATTSGQWDNDPTFDYCIHIGNSYLPNTGTNTNGALLADVIRGSGSNATDQYYQLSEGSIAIGAGLNGDDIGAYGGDNPYQLSGIPGRPSISRFSLPPTATGLTAVTVEVEAIANPE